MSKGLGIMIGIPSKKSMYEHDDGASDDEAPESSPGAEQDEDTANMRTLFPDASKDDLPDMLEALKAIIHECFEKYDAEPHKEGPNTEESDEE